MRKPYFRVAAGDPPPVRARVSRRARFEEVDALGIVWHGRYASFFEDGRVALGDRYGAGYLDFIHNQVATPIRKLHMDYYLPLKFKDVFSIEARLHYTEAARLNYEFIIRDAEGREATRGYSVQMMLDLEGNVLLSQPDFFEAFCQRWKAGEFADDPLDAPAQSLGRTPGLAGGDPG